MTSSDEDDSASDGEATLDAFELGPEAVVFYEKLGIFAVPIYALTLKVLLPIQPPGQTFSNWDIREKLKKFVHPHELRDLKVVESTSEFINFTTRVVNVDVMDEVITILDNVSFRAPGFDTALRVNVIVGGYPYPKEADWMAHFSGPALKAQEPGNRPDTVYLSGLSYDWFAPNMTDDLTTTMIDVMSQYGKVRHLDIPQEDELRPKLDSTISGMKLHWFQGSSPPFFEMYVQFADYMSFCRAMTSMGGKQLVKKVPSGTISENQYTLDFDRTGHLSYRRMIQRELALKVIIRKMKEDEEEAERHARMLEAEKTAVDSAKEKAAMDAKIRSEIEMAEKRRDQEEEILRNKLKAKKRAKMLGRIRDSENLLKYLMVDLVIHDTWTAQEVKNPEDKIMEYVVAKNLPDEERIRQKLMQKKERELRLDIAKKKFAETAEDGEIMDEIGPWKSMKWKSTMVDLSASDSQVALANQSEQALLDAEAASNFGLTPSGLHKKRRHIFRQYAKKRQRLLYDVDEKVRKFRSKHQSDPYFDRDDDAALPVIIGGGGSSNGIAPSSSTSAVEQGPPESRRHVEAANIPLPPSSKQVTSGVTGITINIKTKKIDDPKSKSFIPVPRQQRPGYRPPGPRIPTPPLIVAVNRHFGRPNGRFRENGRVPDNRRRDMRDRNRERDLPYANGDGERYKYRNKQEEEKGSRHRSRGYGHDNDRDRKPADGKRYYR